MSAAAVLQQVLLAIGLDRPAVQLTAGDFEIDQIKGEDALSWADDSSSVTFVARGPDGEEVLVRGPSFPGVKSMDEAVRELD